MDTTNTKLVLSSLGNVDVIKNPPLWAVVNDACALMELDERSDYFIAFSHALVPWLCKIEVNVYQILFGSVKELEAIYGKNA